MDGQREFVFEFKPKQSRLLPFAEAPVAKQSKDAPKDVFTLETVDIQEGRN